MTTLAAIARDHQFTHLTVTPTAETPPAEYFPNGGRYYRWDFLLPSTEDGRVALDAYTALIDHIAMSYGYPVLSTCPLHEDASFTWNPGEGFASSIYVEDRDEMPCPSFVEDGSCIHSEHTR